MKILLVAKLADNSINSILEPLLKQENIEHIFVLRDTAGTIKSEKVTYITGQDSGSANKLRHFNRLKKGIEICKKHKIDFVIGVLLYPHGYIGKLISLYTHVPYIHVTVAGHREFWLKGKFVEKINFLMFRNSRAITVTGQNTYSYLVSKGYNPESITVLPNVIHMERYDNYNKERKYDIVSLSRIDKNKNISLLLKAIAKLDKSLNTRVIIAGDGPEFNNIKEEARTLGVEENINFPGWVNEEQKNEIYNSAKIFVLCSQGEGFPLSLLEAMACGCVPVVTNVGDISDAVINDSNGYVYNNFNKEDELVSILKSLIEDDEKIKRFSENTKEIKSKYSLENVNKIWADILKKAQNTRAIK